MTTVVGNLNGVAIEPLGLANINTVWGDLNLDGAYDITSLANVRMISGNLNTHHDGISRLQDIGGLEFVGGSADFMPTRIRNFKNLRFIGGEATFPHVPLEAFENLGYVGGNVTIVGIPEADFRSSVHVAGDVSIIEVPQFEREKSFMDMFLKAFGRS